MEYWLYDEKEYPSGTCNGVNPYYFAYVDMYGNKACKASYSLLAVPHGYLPHETENLIESLKIPVVYADGANVKNLAKFHIRLIHC